MTKKQWYKTTQACELLNTHRDVLLRQRRRGDLKIGTHWRVKNPLARRLTYEFNVPAINKFRSGVVTEVATEPAPEVVGIQPALLIDVDPFGITAAGEAVPASQSPRRKPSGKRPHRSNGGKSSNAIQDCDPSSWPQSQD